MPTAFRATFLLGMRAALPFVAMIVPFGALFGVIAAAQGLTLFQALAFSFVVVAGASQFAALQLMQAGAPLLVVILTATAVNLRMAMYSVAMTPHFGIMAKKAGAQLKSAFVPMDEKDVLEIFHKAF